MRAAGEAGPLGTAISGENPLGGLGLLGLRWGRARNFAQAGEEEGLVDATVEDRNPPLAAFDDHVAALQAGLSCKLGGGEVNCHRCWTSCDRLPVWPRS